MKRWIPILVLALASLVHAQNAGNTGTQTMAQAVHFTGVSTTSDIFRNVGQSSHFLTICNTGFSGIISMEESYDGSTNWTTFASDSFTSDSACHLLIGGGYFQNTRVKKTVSGGTFVAYYSASSGPIAVNPTSIGSNGNSIPVGCDQTAVLVVNDSTTGLVFARQSGLRIAVCGYVLTFAAGPGNGTLTFKDSTDGCSTTSGTLWLEATLTTSPTRFPFGSGFGSVFRTALGRDLCLVNASGAPVTVNVSFAQVSQ